MCVFTADLTCFFLYQDAFEELAVQKGQLVSLTSVIPVPFQTLHIPSSRTDLLGVQTPCPLRVTAGIFIPVNGNNSMTSSALHKQRADQGLEFNEDKSWSANTVFKFERTNFREVSWTEEFSDMPDGRKHLGIRRKELHSQQTNATLTTIFKICKQTKNCGK